MRWLALVSVALVLSGCAAKEPEATGGPSTSSTGSGSAAPAPSSTTSPPPSSTSVPPQRPPVAALRATPASGTAPLNVTFAVSVSDPDGDALNWTLSFGDGNRTAGTRSGNATHSFPRGGNFTATLVATDGRANTTATVRVAVEATVGLNPACQRPDATETPVGLYVDDRGGLQGEGTWVYEETNDLPGLQLSQEPSAAGEVDPIAVANGCTGGDTLLF